MAAPVLDVNDDPKAREAHYVHEVYNDIAPHFSLTRYKPWPIVQEFLLNRKNYSVGIDVGCGNGKYLGINPKIFIIGSDRSAGLLECAKKIYKNRYEVCLSDGLSLAHPNEAFDFAISIAVIHHFSTKERRIRAIEEIISKIKKGGELLIYCWALEQENSRRGYKAGDDQDVLVPWITNRNSVKTGRQPVNLKETEVDRQDATVHENKTVNYRYYHLYKEGELEEDVGTIEGCTVSMSGYEKDNWWAIVRKN